MRRVVTGALEVERREKRIGASLEAAVLVHASDPETRKALAKHDLAELFITSGAAVTEGTAPAEAFRLSEVPDVAVEVRKAPGRKCARCWKVLEEVRPPEELCARCHEVVEA